MVGTSMFVGDAICQKVENRTNGKEWDTKRSQIMGITGLCVSGPISHTVVYTLERFIPGNSVKASLMKMTCNTVLAPVTMSILFTAVLLMKGKTIDDAREKIKQGIPIRVHSQSRCTKNMGCRSSILAHYWIFKFQAYSDTIQVR
jgi:hypothetical protein